MVLELLGVLEVLDDQERKAEGHRQEQPHDGLFAEAGLRGTHGKRHRETAADQDDRVGAAQDDVQLQAGFRPGSRIPDAIEHVGEEEPAEEHDLGDEEQPHAERGRLVLLAQRIEVMLQIGMVMRVITVITVERNAAASQQ
jgi:hypothetical protein